jgi:transposase-like protein
MAFKKQVTLTKEELRAQSEAAIKEAMARKLTIKQLNSRKEVKCGKCGAPNRVNIAVGAERTEFKCKECGEKQKSL